MKIKKITSRIKIEGNNVKNEDKEYNTNKKKITRIKTAEN